MSSCASEKRGVNISPATPKAKWSSSTPRKGRNFLFFPIIQCRKGNMPNWASKYGSNFTIIRLVCRRMMPGSFGNKIGQNSPGIDIGSDHGCIRRGRLRLMKNPLYNDIAIGKTVGMNIFGQPAVAPNVATQKKAAIGTCSLSLYQ